MEALKVYLGRTVRVSIDDGRVIQGELQCMDKDLNFIIGGAIEYHGMQDSNVGEEEAEKIPSRGLGLTMVPGKHVLCVKLKGDEK